MSTTGVVSTIPTQKCGQFHSVTSFAFTNFMIGFLPTVTFFSS